MAILLFRSSPLRRLCLAFLPSRCLLVDFHAASLLCQVRLSPSSWTRRKTFRGGPSVMHTILTLWRLCLQIVVLRRSSYLTLPLRGVAAQSSIPAPSVHRTHGLLGAVASAAPRYSKQETLLHFLPLAYSAHRAAFPPGFVMWLLNDNPQRSVIPGRCVS